VHPTVDYDTATHPGESRAGRERSGCTAERWYWYARRPGESIGSNKSVVHGSDYSAVDCLNSRAGAHVAGGGLGRRKNGDAAAD
jgi:hypothetical protein